MGTSMIEQLRKKLAALETHRDALRQLLGKFDETLAAMADASTHFKTQLNTAQDIVKETFFTFAKLSKEVAAQVANLEKKP